MQQKSKKNRKTNLAAASILLVFAAGFILVFSGKATIAEVTPYCTSIISLLTAYGFLKAADAPKQDKNIYHND